MTEAQEQDVVDLLLDQHRQMKDLLERVAKAQRAQKEELFEDLVRLLAVHESAEEEIVHPVARQKIASGDQVVDNRLREEDDLKHMLAELHSLGVDHREFDSKLAVLATAVVEHIANEENEEFPYLRRELPTGRLRDMAGAVRVAEAMAPTRPHPAVGVSATANLLAGPPIAVFDRVRDAIRDWRRTHHVG